MSDDKIAEIRARHQRIETADDDALLVNLEFSWANDDRGWLLAEVERLTRERDDARAEIERLREALTEISQCETSAPAGYEWDIVVEELVEIARKALEAKP